MPEFAVRKSQGIALGNYEVRDCDLVRGGILEYFDLTGALLEPGAKLGTWPIAVTGPDPYVRVPTEIGST